MVEATAKTPNNSGPYHILGGSMQINGDQLINGQWQRGKAGEWRALNPQNRQAIEPAISTADLAQVREAAASAQAATLEYAHLSLGERAHFLRQIAQQVSLASVHITQRYCLETGYPRSRAQGELERTLRQLTLFADMIETGEHLDVRLDDGDPHRSPPKPELRSYNLPLGPVAVFGPANFPLAYGVAGGDTVAALAAGCPVLVKGHPSHPGTSELVARAIDVARQQCQLPPGVFALLQGTEDALGAALVTAPEIKAVGFTGSFHGGTALQKLASQRANPIPVFAEMGSINPVVLLPDALLAKAADIARDFVESLTLHSGQYCVNPGLLIAIKSTALENFKLEVRQHLATKAAGVMLNCRIHQSYLDRVQKLQSTTALCAAGKHQGADQGYYAQAFVLEINAKEFLIRPDLQDEIFGPAAILVCCEDRSQLYQVTGLLRGQLTASIHGSSAELENNRTLMETLVSKVGRLVINGFPTGVEVSWATVHGGPFPATTDARYTAVGTRSIARFLRPVCYQNCPEALLPKALQRSNPLNIARHQNGKKVTTTLN